MKRDPSGNVLNFYSAGSEQITHSNRSNDLTFKWGADCGHFAGPLARIDVARARCAVPNYASWGKSSMHMFRVQR
jgi:hypothetical protein